MVIHTITAFQILKFIHERRMRNTTKTFYDHNVKNTKRRYAPDAKNCLLRHIIITDAIDTVLVHA